MYNFLDPKLLPKVSSPAALENYEASNLISDNFLIKSRGFIAFTTAKPPVDVDFELLCPVSLFYISLSTTVGTQKSTGIEVFVRNSSSSAYTSICRAIFDEPGVVFCNSRFYSKDARPESANKEFHLAFFKSNTFRAFINASSIKIRILRTQKSVPCLSAVEVWGRLARSCSKVTMQTVNKILRAENSLINSNVSVTENKCTDIKEFVIPEDFKDALTFEMMALPMTLPSGHSIDQSTLERCISNNASYGRQGADPFTGLKFTQTRKPVLNVPLKTRIDMFLLQNSYRPETFQLKRTLGRLPEVESKSAGDDKDVLQTKKIKLNESGTNKSLGDALNNVLINSKFMRFTRDDKETNDLANKCSLCFGNDNLYKLPCKHLRCRKCLLDTNVKNLECQQCLCKFKRSELLKFHP